MQRRADLKQYTTDNSVDDFDEIRAALGYKKINLRGGSYGTRSALVYMRRHPGTIRTASLQGVQPISYRNPLPHARSAQNSLDLIFREIRTTPRYARAFPNIVEDFQATLDRLEKEPAHVLVSHPNTGKNQTITLDRNAFAEAVRLQLYSIDSNRRLPLMLMKAYAGDYRELAQAALRQNRGARGGIAWGMLMCVTGSEDISRINGAEVSKACAGTFLGETRIRNQMAVADFWPSGRVPQEFDEPVSVDIPVLLFSGTHDPSTAPEWGAEAARHLPNSLHVVVPGGHGVSGPEIERLEQAFLDQGSVGQLDTSEVKGLKLPPLALPNTTASKPTVPDDSNSSPNDSGPLRFVVSFPETIRATPISGRALLFLSRSESGEPRRSLKMIDPDPVFAIDIEKLQPDTQLVFQPSKFMKPDALAFPGRLDRLKAGTYYAQVLIDQDNTRRSFNEGPGNLYSRPIEVELNGGTGPTYELIADEVIQEEAHEENEWVKLVKVRSELMSDFHGRDVYLRAAVLLPFGYEDEPERDYPAYYVVPGFSGRHHRLLRRPMVLSATH